MDMDHSGMRQTGREKKVFLRIVNTVDKTAARDS